MSNERTCQTPAGDLMKRALEHYKELSDRCCYFSSDIPKAIEFYYRNHPSLSAPSPATPEAEGISGSSQCPICGKDTPHYHGPEAVEARNNIVRAITDQHLLCIKLADALRGMPFPPPMPDDAGNAMRDALKDFDDNSAAYMKAALASPPAAQCECPQHGTWLAAEDIYRMVRELDVAMNGDKAAKQASLCDIFEELKEYIEAAKADVVVPEIPYCAKCWKYGNQHSGECASYPTAAQPETDEKTLWDHPQRVVTERPPVSPELVEQFKGIAAEVAAAQEQKPVALLKELRASLIPDYWSEGSDYAEQLDACIAYFASPIPASGWVKCSERMPPQGEDVLAYWPRSEPQDGFPELKAWVARASWIRQRERLGGWNWANHDYSGTQLPTHWMPLPVAPGETK